MFVECHGHSPISFSSHPFILKYVLAGGMPFHDNPQVMALFYPPSDIPSLA
jgi:hypothetical protein